jgi:predicted TIM-barrel fold metal-dependent hydrolase
MIVDCYTHIWDSPSQLGQDLPRGPGRVAVPSDLPLDPESAAAGAHRHLEASRPVDAAIVLGFKSAYLGAEIPNTLVADYVRRYPDKLIGFAGVDPADPGQAVADVKRARKDLGLRGVGVAPCAQDYHPTDTRAMRVYELAAELDMPLMFHPGIHMATACKLEYAQPVLLDEVAREFPDVKIIIAHMGYPWVTETVALLAKHANLYSDISWLLHHPWEAYQALLGAFHHHVMEKLLFGSGFPYTHAAHCIEALYSINHLVQGTSLPTIPREQLRGIVERDALELLRIRPAVPPRDSSADLDPAIPDEEI